MGLQDLRLAVRLWWRNPWFAALAAVGLGLGIGVNNTFFALTNAAVIRGLPIERADRVMFVGSLDAQDRVRGLSHDDVRSLREAATAWAGVAAFSATRTTLTEQALPADAVMAASISHDGLPLLGRQPARGRAFSAADDSPGAPLVTILSDRLWDRRYGRDPGIVGRAIAPRRAAGRGRRCHGTRVPVPWRHRPLGASGRAARGRRAVDHGADALGVRTSA